jgi:hypothetical protein
MEKYTPSAAAEKREANVRNLCLQPDKLNRACRVEFIDARGR